LKSLFENSPDTFPDHFVSRETVGSLLHRQWISRIWTLQEILLATDPVICCGTKTLSWRSFIYSCAFIFHYTYEKHLAVPSNEFKSWYRTIILWLIINGLQSDTSPASSLGIDGYSANVRLAEYINFLKRVMDHLVRLSKLRTLLSYICGCLGFGLCITAIILFVPPVRAPDWPKLPATLLAIGVLFYIASVGWNIFDIPPVVEFNHTPDVTISESILDEIRYRRATDRKDYVFGAQAILSRLGVSLDIEYSDEVPNIYENLFVKLLSWTGNLELLLCAGCVPNQPSWAPDWSLQPTNLWASDDFLWATGYRGQPLSPPPWHLQDHHLLVVRGKVLSHVTSIYQTLRATTNNYEETDDATHLSNIRTIIKILSDHPKASETLSDPFAPIPGTGLFVQPYIIRGSQEVSDWMWNYSRSLTRIISKTPNAEEILRKLRRKRRLEYLTSLCNALTTKKRTFFMFQTLDSAVGIGNGPSSIQAGDALVMVFGVSMPLVLRKDRDTYRIIGFAFTEQYWTREYWVRQRQEDFSEMVIS
jgi:hypothetical protein